MVYTIRRLFSELVSRLRQLREQGGDIEQVRYDSPELSDLHDWAVGEGVPEREWRWQVTRARAYVRRRQHSQRMTSAERLRRMQHAVSLLSTKPTLTAAELGRLINLDYATARRYLMLAREVIQGRMSVEEAVWGGAGRRGRPRKYLKLPAHNPNIARAVSAVIRAAHESANNHAAMRQAALAILDNEDEVELAIKIAQQVIELEV